MTATREGVAAEVTARTSKRSELFARAENPWDRWAPKWLAGWRVRF